ncbi:hypothetical protein [uncultured Roseobacter sp.]|uniref:hypothetical protein n=1 Tax=uncultured Roseobacter sp. TaxID=114847 RepID=UPI0026124933|nr:hypothetical protein [uncultured Roseobacter sp.]
MSYELPTECDNLCDEHLMEVVMGTLQNARLEHLVTSGIDLETAYEMSELEFDLRKNAYEAEDFVRSVLGVLVPVEKKGDEAFELQLNSPILNLDVAKKTQKPSTAPSRAQFEAVV